MIVITTLDKMPINVCPGDVFNLTITDDFGCDVIICEEITVSKVIDFVASFRFTLEDGTCPGFHLAGIFANSKELPKEIQDAVMLEDLTEEQYKNFKKSVGIKLGKGCTPLNKVKKAMSNFLGISKKEPAKCKQKKS